MRSGQDPNAQKSTKSSIPRWVVPIYWVLGLLIVHTAIPWGISFLSPRYGWDGGNPGPANLYALVLILIGFAIILWTMAMHLTRTSERVELERTPMYLLTEGPYQFSRNQMYLGELVLWLGWSSFFGSVSVLITFVLVFVLMNFKAIPREEHDLEARFGDAYLRYKKSVPRWLGKRKNQGRNEQT